YCMITIENPSRYADENGNVIDCESNLGEKVSVVFRGKNNVLKVSRDAKLSSLKVMFDCNDGHCVIGANRFIGTIRLGEKCSVTIHDGVTCTAWCYISAAEHCSVSIGKDCMFATGNEIRADDAHPIFDVATGARINVSRSILIGDHVWLGARAVVLGGSRIGSGSAIGFGSLVKGNIPNNCVAAGSPARVIRENTAWERDHLTLKKPYMKPDASTVKKTGYWNLTDP